LENSVHSGALEVKILWSLNQSAAFDSAYNSAMLVVAKCILLFIIYEVCGRLR
jgi:hypothetical protein